MAPNRHSRFFAGVARLAALLLLALPAASFAASPDSTAEQIAAFQKAFKSSPKQKKSVDERKEAIALLGEADAPAVAEALVEA